MPKRFNLLTVILLVMMVIALSRSGLGAPKITADAAVVLDARTGSIIYGSSSYQRRPPASITKILTGIIALETGRLHDQVLVSPDAVYTEGSSIYLQPGEKITLEELIWGAMLESGNDACVAIAEYLAGNEYEFSYLQNRKAKAIGAWDTQFVNPHGLPDPEHYSTAYDLGLMARYALRNRKFQQIVRTCEKKPDQTGMARSYINTNRLLWSYSGCDGVKTGTTREAGQCLVASASRRGRQLVAVVLHSDNRWDDAARLLDYGFDHTELVKIAAAGQPVKIKLADGLEPGLDCRTASDLYIVLPAAKVPQVNTKYVTLPNLKSPVFRGEKVGEIQVWLDGNLLARTNLLAAVTMPARNWFTVLIWRGYRPLLAWLKKWHVL